MRLRSRVLLSTPSVKALALGAFGSAAIGVYALVKALGCINDTYGASSFCRYGDSGGYVHFVFGAGGIALAAFVIGLVARKARLLCALVIYGSAAALIGLLIDTASR